MRERGGIRVEWTNHGDYENDKSQKIVHNIRSKYCGLYIALFHQLSPNDICLYPYWRQCYSDRETTGNVISIWIRMKRCRFNVFTRSFGRLLFRWITATNGLYFLHFRFRRSRISKKYLEIKHRETKSDMFEMKRALTTSREHYYLCVFSSCISRGRKEGWIDRIPYKENLWERKFVYVPTVMLRLGTLISSYFIRL